MSESGKLHIVVLVIAPNGEVITNRHSLPMELFLGLEVKPKVYKHMYRDMRRSLLLALNVMRLERTGKGFALGVGNTEI